MSSGSSHAAMAVGALAGEETHTELLSSVASVASAIFGAAAASIFMFDKEHDELVFAAVSGPRDRSLVGQRFPSSHGLAGWVLVTRQSIVIEDVATDERFARDVAERTGYLPRTIMAAPLLHGEEAVGVIQVLDPPESRRITPADLELLDMFGNQAAIGLHLASRARLARQALSEAAGDSSPIGRLVAAVDELEGPRREVALALIGDLERLLRTH